MKQQVGVVIPPDTANALRNCVKRALRALEFNCTVMLCKCKDADEPDEEEDAYIIVPRDWTGLISGDGFTVQRFYRAYEVEEKVAEMEQDMQAHNAEMIAMEEVD